MNIDEILKHDAFRALGGEKIQLYKKLAKELEGKNTMECMGVFMAYQKQLSHQPLTKEEQAAMLAVMEGCLPEEDKKKFNQLMKMMEAIR